MNLKKFLLTAALLALPLSAPAHAADTYKFDPNHTSVIWTANHFGFSSPHGIFSQIEGTLVLDETTPANSKVDVIVPVTKLATGIDKFNDHLKSKDFFNVEKFETAKFVSTKIEKTGTKTAKLTGDLTIVGVTKPVTLDVTFNQKGDNAMTKVPTIGFSATGTIKRSEFGLNYAIPAVSDDVKIQIEAEANK